MSRTHGEDPLKYAVEKIMQNQEELNKSELKTILDERTKQTHSINSSRPSPRPSASLEPPQFLSERRPSDRRQSTNSQYQYHLPLEKNDIFVSNDSGPRGVFRK